MIWLQAKKAGLELLQASHLTSHQSYALVAVVIMLIMLVSSMAPIIVRLSSVVRRSVRWIAAVVAARVVPIPISRISVVAVTIGGITDPD